MRGADIEIGHAEQHVHLVVGQIVENEDDIEIVLGQLELGQPVETVMEPVQPEAVLVRDCELDDQDVGGAVFVGRELKPVDHVQQVLPEVAGIENGEEDPRAETLETPLDRRVVAERGDQRRHEVGVDVAGQAADVAQRNRRHALQIGIGLREGRPRRQRLAHDRCRNHVGLLEPVFLENRAAVFTSDPHLVHHAQHVHLIEQDGIGHQPGILHDVELPGEVADVLDARHGPDILGRTKCQMNDVVGTFLQQPGIRHLVLEHLRSGNVGSPVPFALQ